MPMGKVKRFRGKKHEENENADEFRMFIFYQWSRSYRELLFLNPIW